MSQSTIDHSRLRLVADIVSAHVANHTLAPTELPDLIRSVYTALERVGTAADAPAAAKQEPAVPVKASVFADYIICLEDGKKLKTLKRHLQASYRMTPEEYRHKWGLPDGYPMVAPNYASRRSALAKQIGLGRKRDVPGEATGEIEIKRIPAGVSAKQAARRKVG